MGFGARARSAWRRGRWPLLLATAVGAVLFGRSLDGHLATRQPSQVLLDRQGRFLGELGGTGDAYGYWPLPAVMPDKVVVTTLETEDRHFFEHPGVHSPSVVRAAWQDLKSLHVVSGASTIAMQVARMQHPSRRTPWAKVREAAEALLLIRQHGHDLVLRQYLTVAPYGNRCHGIVRAARLYFDKPVEDLSWLQAAYLAALPQQPGRMSAWTKDGHARALKRARRILGQLHQRGLVNDEDYRVALQSDLMLVKRPHRHPEAMHALLRLARHVPKDGAVVHTTTLDLDVQQAAQKSLNQNLETLRGAGAGNTAGVVMDLPSGEVLAYVGSADYFDQEHRGAIDYLETRRSPGSSLKPFLYAMGLERHTHTAATELPDTAVEFVVPGGGLYVPENITHTFLGPMLLRQALGNSRNIPALRVLSDLGVDRAVELFERGGVQQLSQSADAYGLTLAIGSLPVTPMELATLYTALANRGEEVKPSFFQGQSPQPGPRLYGPDAAMLVTHILADPEARRPAFAANGPLDFDVPAAVKTGTSQGYRDAWASAYTDRLLVVAWVGNHDWRRMNLVSGATAAAPAVKRIVDTINPLRQPWRPSPNGFSLPGNIVEREVCALSGRLPGKGCTSVKTEYFLPGTEPIRECPFHVEVAIDTRNGLRAGPACPAAVTMTRPMLDLPEVYEGWARRQRLAVAPTQESPLCPTSGELPRKVSIREPRAQARFLFDPDTPREFATVRLSASVSPATEEVVWLVDGEPVARVGYPHEVRWPLAPGTHTIRAALAHGGEKSAAVTVVVDD